MAASSWFSIISALHLISQSLVFRPRTFFPDIVEPSPVPSKKECLEYAGRRYLQIDLPQSCNNFERMPQCRS
ncbi:hypothetical protein B0O99DRAFT_643211 [Bisporella sp. PMI_857]|nr:hypothetical protein B0O99DRAFT_643211 [Bisporella sp. PMI_857]